MGSSETDNILTHDVCFKNKQSPATDCPATPVVPMAENKAKFFNQIVSSSNNASTPEATYDNVQFDQIIEAVGVCSSTDECQAS